MKKITILILGCLPLLLFGQKDNKMLPLDPMVRTGKLSNGFTYYLRKNTQPLQKAELYLVMKVGSILEEEDQRGLAHFMEHMNFKGTKNFPKNKLIDYLEKQGVKFGADLNAYTSFDETVYQLPITTADPKVFAHGLQIMRDWAQDALMETVEVNRERGVILEEKRSRTNVQSRMQEQTFPVMMNNSRYAQRLPIGTEEVIRDFFPERLLKFHRDWYRPDLQALIVVGDIDVDQVEQQVKKLFRDMKNPSGGPTRKIYHVELKGQNHFLSFTDSEVQELQLQIMMKMKKTAVRSKSDFRTALVNNMVNSMLAGRYGEAAQQPGLSYVRASAGWTSLMADVSSFSLNVVPKPGEIDNAFKAAWRELDRAKRLGFTAGELDRVKVQMMMGIERMFKEMDKIPSDYFVKMYQLHFLTGEAALNVEMQCTLLRELVPSITLKEVQQIFNSMITDRNRDIVVTAPERDKAGLPDEKTVLTWIREAEETPLAPYMDDANLSGLMEKKPASGMITAEQEIAGLEMTELRLSNGIKVFLKPTDFKNDEVLFTGFSKGGVSLYNVTDISQASNAISMVVAMGLSQHTPIGLGKLLNGKSVSVSPAISELGESVNGATRPADLETALQLVNLYFTEPRFDKTLFENIVSRSRPMLESRYNDANTVFRDTVSVVMSGYHPRFILPSLQMLEGLSVERMLEIYNERFGNAADFTFVFTGNIDTKILKPLLETYLGSLPAKGKMEEAIDHGMQPPRGRIEKVVREGKEDKATVQLVYSGDFIYNRPDALAMNALNDVLQLRLTERLRMLESGVYSPSVQITYSKFPPRYSAILGFGCAPGRVNDLVQATEEEVARLKKDGPTAEEMQKFVAAERLDYQQSLKQNGYWLQSIVSKLQNEEPLENILNFPKLLDELRAEKVQEVAQRYLDKDLIVFKLLPKPR